MTFTVFSIPGSPFGRAVLAVLEEKGADYRLEAVTAGAHRAEPHLSRHPFGRIPAMDHDGFGLFETQAMVRYIDRVVPNPPLTPSDPKAAARMDQAMNISDWYVFQGAGNVIGFQRVVLPRLTGAVPDEAAIAAAMPKAHQVFGVLEGLLSHGPYFAGEGVSLADFMLAAQIDFFVETPEWTPLSAKTPRLKDWIARMSARPSLAATTWDKVAAMAA